MMQMKVVFFCKNPYAFGILKPLAEEAVRRNLRMLWYLPQNLEKVFPFNDEPYTTSIEQVLKFQSDVILVPGNEVPHFLRGVKTQIFHGFAGEKKGHFRIRNYFDLYLTQGPNFTERFHELRDKHMNFHVIETGWSKLDPLFESGGERFAQEKAELLKKHNVKHILLYAPTFSPSLASAKYLQNEIVKLEERKDTLVLVKFHDLMDKACVEKYNKLAYQCNNIVLSKDRNILKLLVLADVLISDTSSVVYEFILLNKPVITFRTKSPLRSWINIENASELSQSYDQVLTNDNYKEQRQSIIDQYHPYTDGNSSARVFDAIQEYIDVYGIPNSRTVSLFRQIKMNRMFKD